MVMMGTLLDTHWKVFARIAGRDDLATDPDYATIPGRMKHRGECNAVAAKWCLDHSVAQVLEICGREGIACAPVNTYEQAAHDPHLLARDMLQDTVQEDGSSAPIVGPAIKFSRTPTKVRSGARALGADNDQILGELGIDANARNRLRGAKVI
jgi:formyl-CoA transferase